MKFERRVQFSETDASGRMHFTSLLKWVEEAEHELLRDYGIQVFEEGAGWPRAHISCDYQRPVVFGDEVLVALTLNGLGEASLSWAFEVRENRSQKVVASGAMVTVYCSAEGRPVTIPDEWRAALSVPLTEEDEPKDSAE